MSKILIPFIFTSLLLASCSNNPQIEGFDASAWKKDSKACKNERIKQASLILQNKETLMGLPDTKLLRLLGKPDMQNYFERGKKNYHYFIEPGNQCDQKIDVKGKRIVFEVNALGKVIFINEQNF